VVCNNLNLDGPRWDAQKEVVSDCIRTKRANCCTSMKREYFGMIKLCDLLFCLTFDLQSQLFELLLIWLEAALKINEQRQVPSLRNILLLRKLSNNSPNDDYIYFCVRFFKCIVGVQAYNAGWDCDKKLSEIATPSDEALALLILENNEARWSQEFDMVGSDESRVTLPKAKYTSSGRNTSMKGFTKKFGGWSARGIERFNELLKLVKADRSANGEWFDNILLERKQQQESTAKPAAVLGEVCIKADNDLFDFEFASRNNDFCLGLGNVEGFESHDDDGDNADQDDEEELLEDIVGQGEKV
jgi:hypothetical protein